jgi:hypothetical protein
MYLSITCTVLQYHLGCPFPKPQLQLDLLQLLEQPGWCQACSGALPLPLLLLPVYQAVFRRPRQAWVLHVPLHWKAGPLAPVQPHQSRPQGPVTTQHFHLQPPPTLGCHPASSRPDLSDQAAMPSPHTSLSSHQQHRVRLVVLPLPLLPLHLAVRLGLLSGLAVTPSTIRLRPSMQCQQRVPVLEQRPSGLQGWWKRVLMHRETHLHLLLLISGHHRFLCLPEPWLRQRSHPDVHLPASGLCCLHH